MKTVGIIGGMSWESTAVYYRLLNEKVRDKVGGLHSLPIILHSVNFAEIEQMQREGEWERAGVVLADIARKLEGAGADIIILATNTMHKVARQIQELINVPFLHIAEETARRLLKLNVTEVALIGTNYTMEDTFYRERLERKGIEVFVPTKEERHAINLIIFEELCRGQLEEESKEYMLGVIERLQEQGAKGVIFGCTEIGLLLAEDDVSIPVFDTTLIHIEEVIQKALQD